MALRRCLHRCLWLWGSLCYFVDWKVLHVSKAPRVVAISRATSNQPSWVEMVESIEENDTRIAIPKAKDIEKKFGYNNNLSSFLHSKLDFLKNGQVYSKEGFGNHYQKYCRYPSITIKTINKL